MYNLLEPNLWRDLIPDNIAVVPTIKSIVFDNDDTRVFTAFAIGNDLTNPEIHYGAYGDYALDMKIISESDHESLKQDYVECQSFIKKCNLDGGLTCDSAYETCNDIFSQIMSKIVGKNYYDIRKKCVGSLCYDFSKMENFLNQENVRKALGVGKIKFVSCSTTVYDEMRDDWMHNLEVKIPALVEDGINLLVYAGLWVDKMSWSGQKNFGSVKTVPFLVDGKEAGLMKNYGSLTFLKVHDGSALFFANASELDARKA